MTANVYTSDFRIAGIKQRIKGMKEGLKEMKGMYNRYKLELSNTSKNSPNYDECKKDVEFAKWAVADHTAHIKYVEKSLAFWKVVQEIEHAERRCLTDKERKSILRKMGLTIEYMYQ